MACVQRHWPRRSATIRETIGIAAYRIGDWSTALTELRAYRRMAGETTHLPIEMDVLRALGRKKDVEKAWQELEKRGGHGLVMNEGRIVYASYLLDEGRGRGSLEDRQAAQGRAATERRTPSPLLRGRSHGLPHVETERPLGSGQMRSLHTTRHSLALSSSKGR